MCTSGYRTLRSSVRTIYARRCVILLGWLSTLGNTPMALAIVV
jgi:hypothetical protein